MRKTVIAIDRIAGLHVRSAPRSDAFMLNVYDVPDFRPPVSPRSQTTPLRESQDVYLQHVTTPHLDDCPVQAQPLYPAKQARSEELVPEPVDHAVAPGEPGVWL